VVTGGVVTGAVVAGGVVAGGVAGAVLAGAGFVVVRPPVVDARAASWDWVVDDVGAGVVGAGGVTVPGASGTAAGVDPATGAGGRTRPPNASFAVLVGSDGPAVARAIPRPEPEMITAVRIRNAARRRGSSRRWERIMAPPFTGWR
jgi:hypothetical protein